MGLTAIIGDALTDHTAHPFGIFLDGLDVIKEYRGAGVAPRFGVDIDSIQVTEAGPGGVSSMSFSIDDPSLVLSFSYAARVEYWDLTRNVPLFVGQMQAPTIMSDFGQQGRSFDITAVGIESLLDSIIIPSLTVAAGSSPTSSPSTFTDAYFMALFGGFGPFRATGNDAVPTAPTQALPMLFSAKVQPAGGIPTMVFDGMSIRQAYEAVDAVLVGAKPIVPMFMTSDFYGGIRLFPWGGGTANYPTFAPSDYSTITIDNSPGGTLASSNLSWTLDGSPTAVVNAVYIKGATAAGTGWVAGDPAYGRRERYVTASSTDASTMLAAGYSAIGQHQQAAGRGQLTLERFTPVNAHPGSQLTITDARQGWAAQLFTITEISKTFDSNGTEEWTISFADPAASTSAAGPPSAARLMRTLTRGTN